MADPSPIRSLPNSEFIELYNRTNKILDLEGWQIDNGTTTGELPPHVLLPDSYLILAPIDMAERFESFVQKSIRLIYTPLSIFGKALSQLQSNIIVLYYSLLDKQSIITNHHCNHPELISGLRRPSLFLVSFYHFVYDLFKRHQFMLFQNS